MALEIRRLLRHTLVLLLMKVPLQLVGIVVLLPVLAVLNIKGPIDRLPRPLRWFDNAESFLVERGLKVTEEIDGVYGDVYDPADKSWLSRTWQSYVWLGWRNPVNYFQTVTLGRVVDDTSAGVTDGNSSVADVLHQHNEGWYYQGFYEGGDIMGDLYVWEACVIKSLRIFKFRLRVGYKIGEVETQPVKPYQAQWVFSIGTKGID